MTLSAEPMPLRPGSPEALEQGCFCPVLDNAHGAGYMGGVKAENGETIFLIDDACPLHKEFGA